MNNNNNNNKYADISSSRRYKKHIIDLPSKYIDDIYRLKPAEFSYKMINPKKRIIGFIDEDVTQQHVIDPSVIEGFDYAQLIVPLVAIIKNYQTRISANENCIEKQEMMIEKLTYRIDMLETASFQS